MAGHNTRHSRLTSRAPERLLIDASRVAAIHTYLALAAFGSALLLGCVLHYKKIVKNGVAGYPEEWFPSVSATSATTLCALIVSMLMHHSALATGTPSATYSRSSLQLRVGRGSLSCSCNTGLIGARHQACQVGYSLPALYAHYHAVAGCI